MKIKIMKTLLSVAVLTSITNGAYALGTAADTAIDNTATITYSVGTTPQTGIKSSPTGNSTPGVGAGDGTPTTFLVDKKIDLLVTGGNTTNVVPGLAASAATNLQYTFKNQGNSEETFTLSVTDDLTIDPGNDDFDSTSCTIASVAPATAATLPEVTLAAEASVTVNVQCAIPASSGTVKDEAKTLVELLATTNTPSTTSTNAAACNTNNGTSSSEACTIDVVNADGKGKNDDAAASNGQHSDYGTYLIETAALSVKKTEAVSNMTWDHDDDPGTAEVALTGTQYHTPGSTITYTVEVDNTASAASDLIITDTLDSNLTFGSCSVSGSPAALVPAAPTCGLVGSVVTTGAFTLSDGGTTPQKATMTIIATIK